MAIFNKAEIDQLRVVRKRIKQEFGSAPPLDTPDLLEDILKYSTESKDAITKSQIRQLMEIIGEPWPNRFSKLHPYC
ncbi:MAG: hypothetical protein JKX92_07035 [Porticoccaceae bacterium]|nr:hypothetical protein [Porticoccaceae bacterium]OUS02634.1 hypothetical protein A9Q90_09265 [Gammaproteobacteria bacterium 54_18_T64]